MLISVATEANTDDITPVQLMVDSTADTTSKVEIDTILFIPAPDKRPATQVTNPADFEKNLTQPPTLALFKSMFVPGLGQLGNRKYIKAFFIIGLESWFIGEAIHYGKQASDAKKIYEQQTSIAARNSWYDYYDNKNSNKNKYLWYTGITIFLSMFDAYVDAHLSGAPTDERNDKFDLEIKDTENGPQAALVLRF